MPLRFEVGQKFPAATGLVDDRGKATTVAEVAGARPLLLCFYRGPW